MAKKINLSCQIPFMGERSGRSGSKDKTFFTCSSCFEEHKVVYPYESAKDSEFRCRCGGKLTRFSDYESALLFSR